MSGVAPSLSFHQGSKPFWVTYPHAVLVLHTRKIDVRLPEKRNPNSHGARPVHLNNLDDKEDSDRWVLNKELFSLFGDSKP